MVGIPPYSDADILETIRDGLIVRFVQVAAGALFAHDVLLSLDVEFKYIWAALNPRKRPIKIAAVAFNLMYLVQRYLPLWDRIILDTYYILGPSDTKTCEITYKMSAWSTIMGILLSEFILVMRIWAVWLNKPSVRAMLVALKLACLIPALLFFLKFVGGIQCPQLPISGMVNLPGCFCSAKNKDLYGMRRLKFFEACFVLMAIPGFKAYQRGGRSNLMKVVYQDGEPKITMDSTAALKITPCSGVIYYASIFSEANFRLKGYQKLSTLSSGVVGQRCGHSPTAGD
ncbi:hypothetical protein E1B28_010660 [Marasmius oreades]|uniref:DUF6533 domain-containing protein n=1 Tax=Marasmius oreades TaxID=181124 RepID=A0A9P7UTW2_9AGAR|nr:uncharacterized protein E1B28_010660 [Marasmius oreades]KAG7091639.1 hypothetical protein E1B28_010660 [Marasmius oreades]